MHGIILVEGLDLLDLAHHDDNGRDAAKEGVARPLVSFPDIDEVGHALLEEFCVDLDCLGHGDDSCVTIS